MEYLGIDVGGSAIKHALMDSGFDMRDIGETPGPFADREAFLAAIASLYDEAGRPEGGIVMSYCGELDEETGQIYIGGSYPFNAGTNLKVDLAERCGCAVSVEHDGRCAALAELERGSLRGRKNALAIVIGSGLGGGIIIDGKVLHGSHKMAGALSALPTGLDVDVAGISFDAIPPLAAVQLGAAALAGGYNAVRGDGWDGARPSNGKEFFALANDGDEVATQVLGAYCRKMANLIFQLQLLLDVEAVAIGGGVSAAPALGRVLAEELDRVYASPLVTYIGYVKPQLSLCTFRNEANLIGALCHRLRQK